MSTVSNLQFSNSGNGTITVTFTAPSSGTWSTSSFFYNITGSSSSFFNTFSSFEKINAHKRNIEVMNVYPHNLI